MKESSAIIEELTAENARLAAALEIKHECLRLLNPGPSVFEPRYHVLIQRAMSITSSTALSELLAPTIETLSILRKLAKDVDGSGALARTISSEISRLRNISDRSKTQ
jgi:hypothetical protein